MLSLKRMTHSENVVRLIAVQIFLLKHFQRKEKIFSFGLSFTIRCYVEYLQYFTYGAVSPSRSGSSWRICLFLDYRVEYLTPILIFWCINAKVHGIFLCLWELFTSCGAVAWTYSKTVAIRLSGQLVVYHTTQINKTRCIYQYLCQKVSHSTLQNFSKKEIIIRNVTDDYSVLKVWQASSKDVNQSPALAFSSKNVGCIIRGVKMQSKPCAMLTSCYIVRYIYY